MASIGIYQRKEEKNGISLRFLNPVTTMKTARDIASPEGQGGELPSPRGRVGSQYWAEGRREKSHNICLMPCLTGPISWNLD